MGEIRPICSSIEPSFLKYDNYPKSVSTRVEERYQMQPTRRPPDARVSPVLRIRSDLSEALLIDDAIKFSKISMAKVLTDYPSRKEIPHAFLKRFGCTTRQNMSVLASVVNALGLPNATEMNTVDIKITLRAPDCDLGRVETIAGVTRISNFPQHLAMAFA